MVMPKRKKPPRKCRIRTSSVFVLCLGVASLVYLDMVFKWKASDQPIQSDSAPVDHVSDTVHDYARPRKAFQRPMPLAQSIYDTPEALDDENDGRRCLPMQPWQTKSFFSCNNLHDLDMSQINFINCGTNRCAFSLDNLDGSKITLKVQMYSKDITEDRFLNGNRDALAMERLTASPYIANIFGSCGTSQLTDYSDGGNIHDVIKRARLGDDNFRGLSPLLKLKIGYQLVSAVADMHSFESNNVPSLAHNDLCCHQFIYVDGVFKLNDFHLSVFIEKHPESGEPCKFIPFFNRGLIKLRAPEEVEALYNPRAAFRADAVDVYMLGNVIYYLLTNLWAYDGFSNREAVHEKMRGRNSPIPEDVVSSSNGAIKALVRAVQMCWTADPRRRPAAKEVAEYLRERLKLEGVNADVNIKVDLPRLPKDHRYTDSDFYDNLSY